MKIEYPAIFDPADEGGYTISFPDFPEAISEGDSLEEANYNAIEVLDLTLKSRMEDNETIPLPHFESGVNVYMVAPDVNIQAALLVKLNRGEKKFSDLARTLGTSWPAVSRLEDPKHWPSLRQLDKLAAALGKRLVLSLE
ncbi:MAG: type II toxin-antitoxin system HicB family antitoxin [Desulfuromonadales bacterium]